MVVVLNASADYGLPRSTPRPDSRAHERRLQMSVVPSTCDLCDAHEGDASLRVLPPLFRSFGGAVGFQGPAATLQCFEDNSAVRAALEERGEGRVLMIDGGASMRCALVGGNLAALGAKNGWAGIVVDGCVRDAAELAAAAIGIRALGLHPLRSAKRGEGRREVAVRLQGVTVRPGDWIVADADGVVVLDKAPS
jgi:regulator of ribonuclease activity A